MSPTIQKPVPAFTVSALVDGAFKPFKQVSLSDFLGQWYLLYPHFVHHGLPFLTCQFFRVILMFYPL
jgi:alkyl hydroperoxide reductase subunit AhpC